MFLVLFCFVARAAATGDVACDAVKLKTCADVHRPNCNEKAPDVKCLELMFERLDPSCKVATRACLIVEAAKKPVEAVAAAAAAAATLSGACNPDKAKFCKDIVPGEGRTHKCLRDHLDELAEQCKQDEFAHLAASSADIRLKPAVRYTAPLLWPMPLSLACALRHPPIDLPPSEMGCDAVTVTQSHRFSSTLPSTSLAHSLVLASQRPF